jgi:thiamine biosynthesis protein ThiS
MRVQVNGEDMELEAGLSVRGLIQRLGLGPAPVGVELNGQVLLRSAYNTTELHEGDIVELAHFAAGG